jgi:uncharacterized membrane protein
MPSCVLIGCNPMSHSRKIYGIGLCIASVWMLWIAAAPWLMANGYTLPALISYRVFSLVCHQQAERSLALFGFPLAVCARCFGIYFGCVIGWLSAPWMPIVSKRIVFAALVPLLFDLLLDASGIRANTSFSRLLTGLLAGGVVACYFWIIAKSTVKELCNTYSGEELFHG